MSDVLFIFLIGFVVMISGIGGMGIHIVWTLTMDNPYGFYCCFWKELWGVEFLSNINNFGKIIIEILYTITFATFLIIYNSMSLLALAVYYGIIKPFAYIFRKGGGR